MEILILVLLAYAWHLQSSNLLENGIIINGCRYLRVQQDARLP